MKFVTSNPPNNSINLKPSKKNSSTSAFNTLRGNSITPCAFAKSNAPSLRLKLSSANASWELGTRN